MHPSALSAKISGHIHAGMYLGPQLIIYARDKLLGTIVGCVEAVKGRPVLHHCVVLFSGPQGSWRVHVCCLHL